MSGRLTGALGVPFSAYQPRITRSAAGGIFAIIKGAWLYAGMGIAIAGLMFGAQLVASSSGFGALI